MSTNQYGTQYTQSSGVVKFLPGASGTSESTVPQPLDTDGMSLQGLSGGIAAWNASQRGKDKDYTKLEGILENYRTKVVNGEIEQGGSEQEVLWKDTVKAAVKAGYSPSDISGMMKIKDIEDLNGVINKISKDTAEKTTSFYEQMRIRGATQNPTGTPMEQFKSGVEWFFNNNVSDTLKKSLPDLSLPNKIKAVQKYRGEFMKNMQTQLNEMIANSANKELNSEMLAAFKSQQISELLDAGYPVEAARGLVDDALGVYSMQAELATKDVTAANDYKKAVNELVINGQIDDLLKLELPTGNNLKGPDGKDILDEKGNPIPETYSGARLAAMDKVMPDVIKNMNLNEHISLLKFMGSGKAGEDLNKLSDTDWKWVVSSNGVAKMVRADSPELKAKAAELAKGAQDKVNAEVKNTPIKEAAEKNIVNAASVAFTKPAKGTEKKDWAEQNDQVEEYEKTLQVQAEKDNEFFDGDGVVLVDPKTGTPRYFTTDAGVGDLFTFNNQPIYDASDRDWLLPWGNAEDARDAKFAIIPELINAGMIRTGLPKEEVIRRYNVAMVKASSDMRKLVDSRRQMEAPDGFSLGGIVSSMRSGQDVPMSDKEAEEIVNEALGITPPKMTAAQKRGLVTDELSEAFIPGHALGGVISEGVEAIKEGFDTRHKEGMQRSKAAIGEATSTLSGSKSMIGSVKPEDVAAINGIDGDFNKLAALYLVDKEGFVEAPRMSGKAINFGYGHDEPVGRLTPVQQQALLGYKVSRQQAAEQLSRDIQERVNHLSRSFKGDFNSLPDRLKIALIDVDYHANIDDFPKLRAATEAYMKAKTSEDKVMALKDIRANVSRKGFKARNDASKALIDEQITLDKGVTVGSEMRYEQVSALQLPEEYTMEQFKKDKEIWKSKRKEITNIIEDVLENTSIDYFKETASSVATLIPPSLLTGTVLDPLSKLGLSAAVGYAIGEAIADLQVQPKTAEANYRKEVSGILRAVDKKFDSREGLRGALKSLSMDFEQKYNSTSQLQLPDDNATRIIDVIHKVDNEEIQYNSADRLDSETLIRAYQLAVDSNDIVSAKVIGSVLRTRYQEGSLTEDETATLQAMTDAQPQSYIINHSNPCPAV